MEELLQVAYVLGVSIALVYALFDYRTSLTHERFGSGARGIALIGFVIVMMILTAHAFDEAFFVKIGFVAIAAIGTILHHYGPDHMQRAPAALVVASLITLLIFPIMPLIAALAVFAVLVLITISITPSKIIRETRP